MMLRLLLFILPLLVYYSCVQPDNDRTTPYLEEVNPKASSSSNNASDFVDYPEAGKGSLKDGILNFEREVWQKPNMIINRMGQLKNKTVADIGAGFGYFAFRLLDKAEKVIAIDIDTAAIEFMQSLQKRLPEDFQSRFEARLCPTDDPNLNYQEADMVIMVNTYIYINDRIEYLKKLQEGMAHEGNLVIIDFKKKDIPIGPPAGSRIPLSEVEKELKIAGFKRIKTDDTSLEYQYILTAVRP